MDGSNDQVQWLRLAESCARLHAAPSTVRRWADAGHIRTIRTPGKQRRFAAEDVERIAREGIAA